MGQDFGWRLTNHTTQPSTAAMGTTGIVPGNNTKGSWASLFSAIPNEAYGILIDINANTGASRDTLVDIGVDEAAGTSYTVKIPDLTGSMAITPNKGGIFYYFPLKIKAGSTLGVRASVNNATVATLAVYATLFGKPKRPWAHKTCSFVRAFGVNAAASNGVSLTPGTTSEGAWATIGTTAESLWWWQMGLGFQIASSSDRLYAVDLGIGDGTNKDIVIDGQLWGCDTTNRFNNEPALFGCERWVPSGTGLYMRAQASGTLNSGYSGIVYGGGG